MAATLQAGADKYLYLRAEFLGPIIANPLAMAISRPALLAVPAAIVLLAGISFSNARDGKTTQLRIPVQETSCASSLEDWMLESDWPATELVLGDQVYSRSRLFSLSYNRGNAVANLGLALAAAQLNLAAGADASPDLIDALFQADQWLLDSDQAERRSQVDAELVTLTETLQDFNDQATRSPDCN